MSERFADLEIALDNLRESAFFVGYWSALDDRGLHRKAVTRQLEARMAVGREIAKIVNAFTASGLPAKIAAIHNWRLSADLTPGQDATLVALLSLKGEEGRK